ncbi:MAG: hypothetical protein AVDCRST_MAG89-1903, partial [uncultured Gemmatimonadetes bacterium]
AGGRGTAARASPPAGARGRRALVPVPARHRLLRGGLGADVAGRVLQPHRARGHPVARGAAAGAGRRPGGGPRGRLRRAHLAAGSRAARAGHRARHPGRAAAGGARGVGVHAHQALPVRSRAGGLGDHPAHRGGGDRPGGQEQHRPGVRAGRHRGGRALPQHARRPPRRRLHLSGDRHRPFVRGAGARRGPGHVVRLQPGGAHGVEVQRGLHLQRPVRAHRHPVGGPAAASDGAGARGAANGAQAHAGQGHRREDRRHPAGAQRPARRGAHDGAGGAGRHGQGLAAGRRGQPRRRDEHAGIPRAAEAQRERRGHRGRARRAVVGAGGRGGVRSVPRAAQETQGTL